MSELRVRLDPQNPGQFFACCGLLDLITGLDPAATGHFEMNSHRPRIAYFSVTCTAEACNTAPLLEELRHAEPVFSEHEKAAIRPVSMPFMGRVLELDWWLDTFREDAIQLKCWAGQVTTANLFGELLPLLDGTSAPEDIFYQSRMTKAKFGIDPRSAWNALDFGFSPNEHGRDAATFPAVEILGAIGIQGFRPLLRGKGAKRRSGIGYSLWLDPLPAAVARLAFRAPWEGLAHERYLFDIASRGQSYKYFTFAKQPEEMTHGSERIRRMA